MDAKMSIFHGKSRSDHWHHVRLIGAYRDTPHLGHPRHQGSLRPASSQVQSGYYVVTARGSHDRRSEHRECCWCDRPQVSAWMCLSIPSSFAHMYASDTATTPETSFVHDSTDPVERSSRSYCIQAAYWSMFRKYHHSGSYMVPTFSDLVICIFLTDTFVPSSLFWSSYVPYAVRATNRN